MRCHWDVDLLSHLIQRTPDCSKRAFTCDTTVGRSQRSERLPSQVLAASSESSANCIHSLNKYDSAQHTKTSFLKRHRWLKKPSMQSVRIQARGGSSFAFLPLSEGTRGDTHCSLEMDARRWLLHGGTVAWASAKSASLCILLRSS